MTNNTKDLEAELTETRAALDLAVETLKKIQRLPIRHTLTTSNECFDAKTVDWLAQCALSQPAIQRQIKLREAELKVIERADILTHDINEFGCNSFVSETSILLDDALDNLKRIKEEK